MKYQIDRINLSSITYGEFVEKYYIPETPVILSDTHVNKDNNISSEEMISRFYDENQREAGWFNAALPKEDDNFIKLPDLVSTLLSRPDIAMRNQPMRAFMQPKGHKTLLHYDGNSLNGLNLQIKGEKEWTLISPHTPVSIMPFNFVAAVSKNFTPDDKKFDSYQFTTMPGDMLFLPRYWLHEVTCKADINININWVFTPKSPNFNSLLGQREGELLKLKKMFPFLRKITVNGGEQYGGAGTALEKTYIESIKTSSAIKRLIKEIAATVPFLIHARTISMQASSFSKNNFKVDQ